MKLNIICIAAQNVLVGASSGWFLSPFDMTLGVSNSFLAVSGTLYVFLARDLDSGNSAKVLVTLSEKTYFKTAISVPGALIALGCSLFSFQWS